MTKQHILNAFREMRILNGYASIWKHHPMGVARDIDEWLLTTLTEFEREAIEKLAEEYGDFRISKKNKKGRALRFYLLPHTKHKEGDDEER